MFYGSKRIASHERLYGNNKWQMDPQHYLDLLRQRPQAFQSARPIRQWRAKWPQSLERLFERFCEAQGTNRGIKEFIGVLKLFGDHEHREVMTAVEAAVTAGVSSRQAVEHLLAHGQPRPERSFHCASCDLADTASAGSVGVFPDWRSAMNAAVKAQLTANLKILKLSAVLGHLETQLRQAAGEQGGLCGVFDESHRTGSGDPDGKRPQKTDPRCPVSLCSSPLRLFSSEAAPQLECPAVQGAHVKHFLM